MRTTQKSWPCWRWILTGLNTLALVLSAILSWRPRSLENARAKAIELVGQATFDAILADPRIGQYLQTSVRIYGQTLQNSKGGVPKLIFGSRWVIPEVYNADDLVMILQKILAVPKP